MGRPRIYHTPEEIKEAKRRKSKKYYHKNKELIAFRRGVSKTNASTPPTEASGIALAPTSEPLSPLDFCMKWARKLPDRIHESLEHKSEQDFINQVCRTFLEQRKSEYSSAKQTLLDHLATFSKLHDKAHKYLHRILQLADLRHEYKEIQQHADRIKNVLDRLEELDTMAEFNIEMMQKRCNDNLLMIPFTSRDYDALSVM